MKRPAFVKPLQLFLAYIAQLICAWFEKSQNICYYPVFTDNADFVNHYWRSMWYLPVFKSVKPRVNIFIKGSLHHPDNESKPACFCSDHSQSRPPVLQSANRCILFLRLLQSHTVLVWNEKSKTSKLISILKDYFGKDVRYVATEDADGREYALYIDIVWNMLSQNERDDVINESRKRFSDYSRDKRLAQFTHAYVCGNGPSLEHYPDIDFSDGLRIVCNSSAGNDKLLSHIKPHFAVGGDPVMHFGVSAYAERFRKDITSMAEKHDFLIAIPDFQGFIFYAQYPTFREHMVLIPMKGKVPNYNVLKAYWIPMLWSVANALMLPIAATFCNEIYLLGIDGKDSNKDQEDFWLHAKGSQYTEALSSAHRCHPTFDIHRRAHPEYLRVKEDLALTMIRGEHIAGKHYYSIFPSFFPILKHQTKRPENKK